MPRHPDQTKAALRKDIERLELVAERARRNEKRDPSVTREILSKLSWVKLRLNEEALGK